MHEDADIVCIVCIQSLHTELACRVCMHTDAYRDCMQSMHAVFMQTLHADSVCSVCMQTLHAMQSVHAESACGLHAEFACRLCLQSLHAESAHRLQHMQLNAYSACRFCMQTLHAKCIIYFAFFYMQFTESRIFRVSSLSSAK